MDFELRKALGSGASFAVLQLQTLPLNLETACHTFRGARPDASSGTSSSSSSSNSASKHPGGTHYWYGEHEADRNGSSAGHGDHWQNGDEFDDAWTGGVCACSTDDFVDWR